MVVVTHSVEQTERFGSRLGSLLASGDVVCLYGAIGAGKTSLTRGIASSLGITDPVRSPTFTLVHEHSGTVPLFHIDIYRLEDPEQVAALALDEYYGKGVTVIEWPDRAEDLLPRRRLDVRLTIANDVSRRIELTSHDMDAILERMEHDADT